MASPSPGATSAEPLQIQISLASAASATAPAAVAAALPPSPVRKGLSFSPAQLPAARLNPNGVSVRGPAQFKPNSTLQTPTFLVGDKIVACLVCRNPSVGFNVRGHAIGRPHQKALIEFKPVPAALSPTPPPPAPRGDTAPFGPPCASHTLLARMLGCCRGDARARRRHGGRRPRRQRRP